MSSKFCSPAFATIQLSERKLYCFNASLSREISPTVQYLPEFAIQGEINTLDAGYIINHNFLNIKHFFVFFNEIISYGDRVFSQGKPEKNDSAFLYRSISDFSLEFLGFKGHPKCHILMQLYLNKILC